LSEVAKTSILKLGLPAPLRLFTQLVTVRTGPRPRGSCPRLSGLSRSDFVRWPTGWVAPAWQPRREQVKSGHRSCFVLLISAGRGRPTVTPSCPSGQPLTRSWHS